MKADNEPKLDARQHDRVEDHRTLFPLRSVARPLATTNDASMNAPPRASATMARFAAATSVIRCVRSPAETGKSSQASSYSAEMSWFV